MSKKAREGVTRYLLLSTRKASGEISAAELVEMEQILENLGISKEEAIKAATSLLLGEFEV